MLLKNSSHTALASSTSVIGLDEIFEVADRVTILRDGEHIDTRPITNLTREKMIELMVGRSLEMEFPKRETTLGQARFEVTNLRRGSRVRGVSFNIRAGEVLGLTGLVGAGRTETARLLFGADRTEHGVIRLDGKPLKIKSPRDAIRQGICLLTEDRKTHGLVLGQTARENFGLPNLSQFASLGFIRQRDESREFLRYVDPNPNQDRRPRTNHRHPLRRQPTKSRPREMATAQRRGDHL